MFPFDDVIMMDTSLSINTNLLGLISNEGKVSTMSVSMLRICVRHKPDYANKPARIVDNRGYRSAVAKIWHDDVIKWKHFPR